VKTFADGSNQTLAKACRRYASHLCTLHSHKFCSENLYFCTLRHKLYKSKNILLLCYNLLTKITLGRRCVLFTVYLFGELIIFADTCILYFYSMFIMYCLYYCYCFICTVFYATQRRTWTCVSGQPKVLLI